jgi:glyoxylase-like metal-dependent hydrolase (beta-lactamase superfamily II)
MPEAGVQPEWLAVAGGKARVRVLGRPPDALCSNTYLIRTGPALILIDPGADDAHTEWILEALAAEQAGPSQPVFVLLTHCHRDHARALRALRERAPAPLFLLAQEHGALALGRGDSELTMAFLYNETCDPVNAHVTLLPAGLASGRGALRLADETDLVWHAEAGMADDGSERYCQKIIFVEGCPLEVHGTPGHSPDSICIRLGNFLFIGDLLFADKPGIAGMPGWSQPDLLRSLGHVSALLEKHGIEFLCPGHGPVLDRSQAAPLLARALRNTRNLRALPRLDKHRAAFLKSAARILVDEIAMQLAVLGGRLHLLADRLAELGEHAFADSLRRDLDLDALDGYLADFQRYADMQKASVLEMAVPLKGVSLLSKLDKILTRANLPAGVAELPLRRVRQTMQDYINMMFGFDLCEFAQPADLGILAGEALALLQPAAVDMAEAAAASDDAAAFARFLARRLDIRSCLGVVDLAALSAPGAPFRIRVEPDHLRILLADVLEILAAGSGARVVLSAEPRHGKVRFRMDREGGGVEPSPHKRRYWDLMTRLLGGAFHADSLGVSLDWPAARSGR